MLLDSGVSLFIDAGKSIGFKTHDQKQREFPSFEEFAEPISVYSVGTASIALIGKVSFFELSRRL